jgi:hypothetical protein
VFVFRVSGFELVGGVRGVSPCLCSWNLVVVARGSVVLQLIAENLHKPPLTTLPRATAALHGYNIFCSGYESDFLHPQGCGVGAKRAEIRLSLCTPLAVTPLGPSFVQWFSDCPAV